IKSIETLSTTRVSRRGVLVAGALGVATSLATALHASASGLSTSNRTSEEMTMTPLTTASAQAAPAPATTTDIRPFQVHVPEQDLADLRQRLRGIRFPSKELVADASQGVQLATVQALTRYWGSDYDWRKLEDRLNALPQFMTTIDGVDI